MVVLSLYKNVTNSLTSEQTPGRVLEFVLLFVLGFALEFVIEIPGRVLLCAFFYKDSTTIGAQRGVRLFLKYSQTFFF